MSHQLYTADDNFNRFKVSALTIITMDSKKIFGVEAPIEIGTILQNILMLKRNLLLFVTKLSLLTFIVIANPVSKQEALADFRVCNGTQSLVGVAIGYRASEGWVSEGWWQVAPTSCETLIEGKIESRFYYIYAEDAAGGGRWGGDVNMCVSDTEFKVVGVQDCFARGFQRIGFKEYDTGRQGSWMVQLTDGREQEGNSAQ